MSSTRLWLAAAFLAMVVAASLALPPLAGAAGDRRPGAEVRPTVRAVSPSSPGRIFI